MNEQRSRLELVAATPDLTRAALAGRRELASELVAAVPSTWPPMYLDPSSVEPSRFPMCAA